MYKTYYYEEKYAIVHEYRFLCLHDFLKYIQEKEVNQNIFDHCSSVNGRYDFTKTKFFDDAVRLCQYGWNENLDKLLELKEKIDQSLIKKGQETIKRSKSVMGFAPSMSDIIAGNPLNMWQIQKKPNFDIIRIYASLTYPGYTKSPEIYNRGAILLSLIDILEKIGYGVELISFEISHELSNYRSERNEIILSYFSLKDSSENLNLGKVYFPLCHPSFLRRLVFRLTEVTPVKIERWGSSYGRVYSEEEIREILEIGENEILFSTPREMQIEGDNIYDDLESVLKITNFDRFFKRSLIF